MDEQKVTKRRVSKPKVTPKAKEVITKKASAPALPSGVDATFKKRKDLVKVYIKRDGKQWFFSQKKADKYFPGDYTIVENPYL